MTITVMIGIVLLPTVVLVLWAICAIGSKAEQEENKIMEKENGNSYKDTE